MGPFDTLIRIPRRETHALTESPVRTDRTHFTCLAFWPGSAEGQARSLDEHIHYCAQAAPRCARINAHPLDCFGAFVKYVEYSATGFVETHRALEKEFHRAYLCLTMPHLNNMGDKVLGIVRAGEAAIPFIMAIERTAGFERLVGRWEEAQHQNALADGRHAYFVGYDGSEPIGFAIVRDWGSREGVTLVKRIAVSRTGVGYGRTLLAKVVDAVFKETDAWRVWLGVFPENIRARRAYETVGFRPEGIARGSVFLDGVHRDELVMAVLRPEWEDRSRRPT
jgi:RimJ/RimL family protein N-acetyltransferase